jgi:hypothetical protein
VVDQHPEAGVRAGTEVPHDGGEVVDALQVLDDDALDAQVVAPHPLHQLRVVAALHVDASRSGDTRACAGHGDRARRGPRRAGRAGPPVVTGRPSSRKPRGSSGNTRCLPKRSSRVTVPASQPITAPQKPVLTSSTTRSGSAGTSGTGAERFQEGVRSGS